MIRFLLNLTPVRYGSYSTQGNQIRLFFFLLLIDSIFKGIKCFFEHQVYAWCGLFYESYMEFTYYFRKYTKKNTWNW